MERTRQTLRSPAQGEPHRPAANDRAAVARASLVYPAIANGWDELPTHSTARAQRQAVLSRGQRAAGNGRVSRLARSPAAIQRDHHTPEARGEGRTGALEGPLEVSGASFGEAARNFGRFLRLARPDFRHETRFLVTNGRILRIFGIDGTPRSRRTFHLQTPFRAAARVYIQAAPGAPALGAISIRPDGSMHIPGTAGAERVEGGSQPPNPPQPGAQPPPIEIIPVDAERTEYDAAIAGADAFFYIVPRITAPPRLAGPYGEETDEDLGVAQPPEGERLPRSERGRATRPAWPASIAGEDLQVPGGIGTFSMRLDYSGAGSDLLTQASAASNAVLYRWKIWDVTRRARERGVTTTEGASQLVEEGAAGRGEDVEQGAAASTRRSHVIHEQVEDLEHGVEDFGGAVAAFPVVLGPLAVLSVASSAVVAAGGELIDTLADSMGGFSEEREIPWREREGAYLIQSIAYPRPQGEHGEIRYVPSRARKLVYVRNPSRVAQAELIRPERELEELQERMEGARDPAERARLQEDIAQAQVNATGSAVDVIRFSLQRVRRQLAALPEWDIFRRRDLERDRDRLQAQMERALERTEGARRVTRPRGVLVSRVSGQRYPLLLQLMDMGRSGSSHRYRLSDVTDRSGAYYDGEGSTPDAALDAAMEEMAGECGYGRGLLVVRIADSGGGQGAYPTPGDRRVECAPRDLALARAKLNDLVTILTALGLFLPGVGEVAAVAGALLAAERMVNRYRHGTLAADAESFTDVVSILGSVAQVGQTVGSLRLARHGRRFALSLERGEAASALAAARGGERARALIRGSDIAGRAIDRIDLVTGNLQTLNDILQVNEEERTGQITHTEARRRRGHLAAQAIQTNGMEILGALREGGGPEGGPDGGPPRPDEVGPIRRPHEDEPGGPTGAPPALGPNERPRSGGEAEEGRRAAPEPETPRPAEEDEAAARRRAPEVPSAAPPVEAPRRLTREEAIRAFTAAVARGTAAGRVAAAEDLIVAVADWRGELARIADQVPAARRELARLALMEARQRIVDRTFARVRQEFPGAFMFNAGTVSFTSDIDITLRPIEQSPGFSGEPRPLPEQLAESSRAALRFGELLRTAVAGETDAVIDTNVYAYIGEQSFAPRSAGERRAEAALAGEVGMAEQMRGQGPEAWGRFRSRLEAELAAETSPEAASARRRVLQQVERAEAYFAAREQERQATEARVRRESPGASDAAVARMTREAIVAEKRARLAELAAATPPDFAAIARIQSEILWFEPEAYATGAAFQQAVAHGQSLRAAGSETTRGQVEQRRADLERLRAASPPDEAAIRRAEVDLAHLERQLETGRFPEAAVQSDVAAIQERERERAEGRTRDEQLAHSAGAASANYGMMVNHIAAAGENLGAAIKAACKYAGRILRAEQFANLETAGPEVRVLLDLFTESRWTIFEGAVSTAILDRMLVRYAAAAGLQDQVTRTADGRETVSDDVRRAFVDHIRSWAEGAVSDLQRVAAEEAVHGHADTLRELDTLSTEGVGAGAPSPARVAHAREAMSEGRATRTDIEVLLRQAVADFRLFRIVDPAAGSRAPETGRLSSSDLARQCGMGRDLSAEALQELSLHSRVTITIDRFQIGDFLPDQSHGFAVVVSRGRPPLRFIVDPTFAQFADPSRERYTARPMLDDPAGAALARDLVRDGFVPISSPEAARLYALGLGADPAQAREIAQRLWGGDEAEPQGAILTERVANGEVVREAAATEAEIPDLDLRQSGGPDELVDEIGDMLAAMRPDDPRRTRLEDLRDRLAALAAVQERSAITTSMPGRGA